MTEDKGVGYNYSLKRSGTKFKFELELDFLNEENLKNYEKELEDKKLSLKYAIITFIKNHILRNCIERLASGESRNVITFTTKCMKCMKCGKIKSFVGNATNQFKLLA
jgi:hypothetical protein